MRRLPVTYRPEARDDLDEVFRYVLRASQSLSTAESFVKRILARCRRIGDVPLGGRARGDLAPGLRTVPFERMAVIAYVVEPDGVRITNVFYGRKDFEALYRGMDLQDD